MTPATPAVHRPPSARRLHRRLGAALAATAVVIGLAACGVPVDKQPAALSRHGIPFGLLNPTPPTSSPTATTSPIEVPVQIFLIDPTDHLVAVARDVPVRLPDLQTVLGALANGPTFAESEAGLQTALAQTTVIDASIAAGVATVNLGGSFGQLVGPPQIQAVAQVVFTASSLPGVTGVTFELSGQPVEVPVASGVEVPIANTSQFAILAPTKPGTAP